MKSVCINPEAHRFLFILWEEAGLRRGATKLVKGNLSVNPSKYVILAHLFPEKDVMEVSDEVRYTIV